jgi:peptidoglycan hydrolase-like protein with peptidoglycan-binding domain
MTPAFGQLYVGKSTSTKGGQAMFRASKRVGTGILLALLIAGMFVACLPSFAAVSEPSQEALAVEYQNDVRKMQLALRDRGHYRGPVDGVIGLRTRASIRAFQNAENLPITGQLDRQTAGKLGVKPESFRNNSNGARQDIVQGQEQTGNYATKGKPWAGTRWAKGTSRKPKTPPRVVPTGANPDGGPGNREDELRAENQIQPR